MFPLILISRAEKEYQRRELEEQDTAFHASLMQDREKEETKDLVMILQQSKRAAIASTRQEVLRKYHELVEPSPDSVPKPIKVALRLPDGSRLNRIFSPIAKFEVLKPLYSLSALACS
jgi:hypothetical protein